MKNPYPKLLLIRTFLCGVPLFLSYEKEKIRIPGPDKWMFAGVSGGYFMPAHLGFGGSHGKWFVEISPSPGFPPAAPYGDYWFQTRIKVRPNTQYSISVDISSSLSPPAGTPFHWAGIEVHGFDSKGNPTWVWKSPGLIGGGPIPSYPIWATDTIVFTTTSTTKTIEIQLWAFVGVGGLLGIPILFDNVR